MTPADSAAIGFHEMKVAAYSNRPQRVNRISGEKIIVDITRATASKPTQAVIHVSCSLRNSHPARCAYMDHPDSSHSIDKKKAKSYFFCCTISWQQHGWLAVWKRIGPGCCVPTK
jgi:hypothetical protein